MLFFGKENVFMCLVAFQNIFRKIFSDVWKRSWKRRRKRQNLEKPRRTRRDLAIDDAISRSTARSRIAIDGAISRSVDRNRREWCFARSRSRIAIDGAISRSVDHDRCFARSCRQIAIVDVISWSTIRVDRDLVNGASREIAPRDLAFFLSLILPLHELSLRVPSSGNHLKWK